MHRRTLVLIALIGAALAAVPVIFSMFTRAPGGATMLAQFAPFMHQRLLQHFGGDVAAVTASVAELRSRQLALAAARLHLSSAQFTQHYPTLLAFEHQWPGVASTLTELLNRIGANIGNFRAVRALPPFPLFPYFFVLPGLMLVGLVVWAARRQRRGGSVRGPRRALILMGLAIAAAPAVFGMFTRAPAGQAMLTAFGPVMTPQKITTVQLDFLQMASGDSAVRDQLLPALHRAGVSSAQVTEFLPATVTFDHIWVPMENQMAPMLATMNNNLGRYAGLAALPPFGLFPYFFLIPGLLVAALAIAGRRRSAPAISRPRPVVAGVPTGKEV